jgi:hypothetical protein
MSQHKPPAGPVHQQFVLDMADRQEQTHKNLGWQPPKKQAYPPQNTNVQTPSVSRDIPGAVPGRTT